MNHKDAFYGRTDTHLDGRFIVVLVHLDPQGQGDRSCIRYVLGGGHYPQGYDF